MARSKVTRRGAPKKRATRTARGASRGAPAGVQKRADVVGLGPDAFERALDLATNGAPASDLESPYKQLTSYYAGNQVISLALIRGEFQLWRGEEEDAEQLIDTESTNGLYDLFRRPNRAQTWRQFASQLCVMLHGKVGAAFIQKAGMKTEGRTPKGVPEELRLIPPSWVEPIFDENDLFTVTKWKINRSSTDFVHLGFDEVVPIYLAPDDEMPWSSVSPLTPGTLDNDTERMAGHYTRTTLKSGGTPGVLFNYKGDAEIPEEDRVILESKLAQRYGTPKSSRFAVVGGDWGVSNLGFNPREMEFQMWRQYHLGATSRQLGIPPLLLSHFEGASGLGEAGLKVQRRILYENKILPLAFAIAEPINELIIRPVDETIEGIFNFDTVEALQEDFGQKMTAALTLMQLGVPLVETNNLLDLGIDTDKIPWATEWLVPMGVVPARLITNPPEPEELPEEEEPDEELEATETDEELGEAEEDEPSDVPLEGDEDEGGDEGGEGEPAPEDQDEAIAAAAFRAFNVDDELQGYIFSKDKYETAQLVLDWLRENFDEAATIDQVEDDDVSWRYRIRPGSDFERLRTVDVGDGVQAVVGPEKGARALTPEEQSVYGDESLPFTARGGAEGTDADSPATASLATASDRAVERRRPTAAEQREFIKTAQKLESEMDGKLVRALQRLSRSVVREFAKEAGGSLRALLQQVPVEGRDLSDKEIEKLLADDVVVRSSPVKLSAAAINRIVKQIAKGTLAKAVKVPLGKAYKAGGKSVKRPLLALGVEADIVDSYLAGPLPKLAKRYVDKHIKNSPLVAVDALIKKKVQASIAQSITNGDNVETAAKGIRTVFKASMQRARVIARTETGIAMNGARQEMMKDHGVTQTEWSTVMDGRERSSHGALNGKRAKFGEPFDNGLLYPNDPDGEPGEIINCRCVALPVARSDQRAVRSGT